MTRTSDKVSTSGRVLYNFLMNSFCSYNGFQERNYVVVKGGQSDGFQIDGIIHAFRDGRHRYHLPSLGSLPLDPGQWAEKASKKKFVAESFA